MAKTPWKVDPAPKGFAGQVVAAFIPEGTNECTLTLHGVTGGRVLIVVPILRMTHRLERPADESPDS